LEYFHPERTEDALARFDELTAPNDDQLLLNASARVAAAFPRIFNERDWDAAERVYAGDVVFEDKRPGLNTVVRGRDAQIEQLRVMAELGTQEAGRTEILAVRGERLVLFRAAWSVTDEEGSVHEIETLLVQEIDETGRICALTVFAPDDVDGATAELELRHVKAEGAGRLENAATRFIEQLHAALVQERDMERFYALHAEPFELHDRRAGLRHVVRGLHQIQGYVEASFDVGMRDFRHLETIAIRGDRIALTRRLYVSSIDGAVAEAEWLVIDEVDADGRVVRAVVFDPLDVEAALDELDDRYVESGGAYPDVVRWSARLSAFGNRQDWSGFRGMIADDCVVVDHRPASMGELAGPDAWLEGFRTLLDLLVRFRLFVAAYHALGSDRFVAQFTLDAEADDVGPVEFSYLAAVHVSDGKMRAFEYFPVDRLEDALARVDVFDAGLRSRDGHAGEPENAAVRRRREMDEVAASGDWDALAACMSEDAVFEDRRAGLGSRIEGRDAVVAHTRIIAEGVVAELEVLATRGDRLLLAKRSLAIGGFDIDVLAVHEFDEGMRQRRTVLFDADDAAAAFSELDGCYADAESAPFGHVVRLNRDTTAMINARDWESYGSRATDDFVLVDHRPASLGELDIERLLDSQRTLVELIPDLRIHLSRYHAIDTDRWVSEIVAVAHTADGAPLDLTFLNVGKLRGEKVCRTEFFPLEQLERAMARFDELGGTQPSGHLTNLAARTARVFVDANMRRDWDAVGAVFTDDTTFDDFRAGLRVSVVGRSARVENSKAVVEVGVDEIVAEVLATRGDRLVLERRSFGSGRGRFEVEILCVTEVDASGRISATWVFDPDDIDPALGVLDARYGAGEGAPYADVLAVGEAQRQALRRGDRAAYRALIADDVVLVDHRPASLGELHGVDAVLEALFAFAPLVKGLRPRLVAIHAIDVDRTLVRASASGTSPDGGAIEMVHLRIQQHRDGKVTRIELFAADALEDALARFDALAAPSTTELGNAVSRHMARWWELAHAGDWDGVAPMISPAIVFEDRRANLQSRVEGRDAFIDSIRPVFALEPSLAVSTLATRGERLALLHLVWTDPRLADEGPIVDVLHVHELDDDGRVVAAIVFDPSDEDAAFAELDQRHISSLGPQLGRALKVAVDFGKASNGPHATLIRSLVTDDFVLVDHRPASFGEVRGADELLRVYRSARSLHASRTTRLAQLVSVAPGGILGVLSMRGVSDDGVNFDTTRYLLICVRDDRVSRMEYFPLDQLAEARARFDDLMRSDLDNACVRHQRRWNELWSAGDWDAMSSIVAPDVLSDDRRAGLRDRHVGRESMFAALRLVFDLGAVLDAEPIAVRGDNLALFHMVWRDPNAEAGSPVVEVLELHELDDDGRVAAAVVFDPDDEAAALAELDARASVS
jgi:ketosteroid isomerase-like protein